MFSTAPLPLERDLVDFNMCEASPCATPCAATSSCHLRARDHAAQ